MKLDHIVINASDLAASLPWYQALLPLIGFEKTGEHVWGNKDDNYIDLRQANEPDKGYERHGAGVNHIGFTAPTEQAVGAIRAAMKEQGFDVPDIQVIDGATCLFMKDRDGFRVEISFYPE